MAGRKCRALPRILLRRIISLVAKIGCFVANYTLRHVKFSNTVANQPIKPCLTTPVADYFSKNRKSLRFG
jgi:hypothetical protein